MRYVVSVGASPRRGNLRLAVAVLLSLGALIYPAACPPSAVSFDPEPINFELMSTVNTPGKPADVLLDEVTASGGEDLVVVTDTQNRLLVYEGDGKGLFTPIVSQVLPSAGTAVAADDYDGNLTIDYAVATANGDITVFFGDGTGKLDNLKTPVTTSFGGYIHDMDGIYSDNNDALPDLVIVQRFLGTSTVLKSNGSGGFTVLSSLTGLSSPSAVTAGHLNADWLEDVVVTDTTTDKANLYLNGGPNGGVFAPPLALSVGNDPSDVALADFNNDNLTDVACANLSAGGITALVAKDSSAANFARKDTAVRAGSLRLVCEPFDCLDTGFDVAVCNTYDSTVAFMRGSSSGEIFWGHTQAASNPSAISSGRANLDSKMDIAVGDFVGQKIQVFRNSCPPKTTRVAGADRYQTAVGLSKTYFLAANWAVIATGQSFPDALSGAPLASIRNAPILLSRQNSLPTEVVAELQRLGVKNVYVLGGEGALSAQVLQDIVAAGVPPAGITRLGGANRYETSYLIAKEIAANSTAFPGRTVVVTTGENYPDALAGGPLACRDVAPILLVRGDEIPAPTLRALAEIPNIVDSYVLGGISAVGPSVESALPSPTRLAGPDRYGTAVAIADQLSTPAYIVDEMLMATGQSFPDALALGAATGYWPNPLLLTRTDSLPPATEQYLNRKAKDFTEVTIAGGIGAVASETVDKMKAAY